MNILVFVLIGSGIGTLGALIFKRRRILLINILCGIVGAVLLGVVASLLSVSDQPLLGFSGYAAFISLLGACLMVLMLNLFTPRRIDDEINDSALTEKQDDREEHPGN